MLPIIMLIFIFLLIVLFIVLAFVQKSEDPDTVDGILSQEQVKKIQKKLKQEK
ncbi:uncharacterized protein DUF843 [Ureibacillus xyleni]|uniref:Uncharacterized protein DUF843 n=1 Tax=Ureibacillus xyleni TaxID=614648 RepID=A0A285RBW2_9BACL|nr:AC76 family protein [Ureibacillus xyleni]SOB91593.1 uncharacterized protein DUF843 [Ureibacillus xyleni]